MLVLGVHDGHDSGATLIKDGKILAAINEERLNRKKLYFGLPNLAIKKVFEVANVQPSEVDHVAVSGTLGMMATLGWDKDISLKKKFYQFLGNKTSLPGSPRFANLQRALFKPMRTKRVERYIKEFGIDSDFTYFDHHKSHAATAYWASGKDNCLVITADGSGDGLSASVYLGKDNQLKLVREIPTFHSLGYFYAYVTLLNGFKMFKHEGKITGLAAFGDPNKCYPLFEKYFSHNKGNLVNNLGLIGHGALDRLKKDLEQYKKEDWAAAVQKRLEDVMCQHVSYWLKELNVSDVVTAGGIFANVKLNQRIAELPGVTSFFVYPNMGDGGLATGAALNFTSEHMLNKGSGLKPFVLNDVYFGPGFSNEDIEKAIEEMNMKGGFVQDIEKYTAELVAEKNIVGHFNGRMEYGPRALGNRSVLVDPTDRTINDWLNKRLSRTEFMPFAPSCLDTGAPVLFKDYKKDDYPSKFMTITFDCLKPCHKAEAVVHVDNTARPQVVTKAQNLRYYNILKNYEKITGLPLFVNTSFNIHEEPIVCTPQDAIKSLQKGCVDYLVMGNWVVKNDKKN